MELDKLDIQSTQVRNVSWVGIIIEDNKENILLVLENDDKAWKKNGQWSTPFGTSKKNEKPINTAIREIKEETWLSISEDNVIEKWKIKVVVSEDNDLYNIDVTIFYSLVDQQVLKRASKFKNCEIWKICLKKLETIKEISDKYIRPWVLEAIYSAKKALDFPNIVKIENGFYEEWYKTSTIKLLKESM